MFYKPCIIIFVIKHTSEMCGRYSSSIFYLEKLNWRLHDLTGILYITCDVFLNDVFLPVGMCEPAAVGSWRLLSQEDSFEQLACFVLVKMRCFLIFIKPVLISYVRWSVKGTFVFFARQLILVKFRTVYLKHAFLLYLHVCLRERVLKLLISPGEQSLFLWGNGRGYLSISLLRYINENKI